MLKLLIVVSRYEIERAPALNSYIKSDKNKCQDCRVKAECEECAEVVKSSRSDGFIFLLENQREPSFLIRSDVFAGA